MKNTSLFLILLFCTQSLMALDIIYGEDDRAEAEETSYTELSTFMGAMVNIENMGRIKTLQTKHKLCSGEKYSDQPSLARCSGLLVKGKYILTAAHCLSHTGNPEVACRENAWLFDYKTHNGVAEINEKKLYHCRRVVEMNTKLDYALIELTTTVSGRYFSPELSHGLTDEPLMTLGFPAGLPLKITHGQQIKRDNLIGKNLFNFDTFHGSSGSPIFNSQSELVGLITSGKSDFFYDKAMSCYRVNQCDQNGEGCSVSDKSELQGEGALLISEIPSYSILSKILN